MAAIAGFSGAIQYATNGASTTLPANDVLTDSGDHTTYGEAVAAHIYWDDTAVPTVQVDTVGDGAHYSTVAASTYTVQYVGGKIIFNTPNTSISLVRISTGGKYWPFSTLALGTDWEFDGTRDFVDVTVFSANRCKIWLPTLTTGTFMIKLFWIDSTFFTNVTTGFRYILSGVLPGGHRYEAYMFTKDDKVHDVLASAIDEAVSFQVTGAWYYN